MAPSIKPSVAQSPLPASTVASRPSLLKSVGAVLAHPALRPVLLSALAAAGRAIAVRVLRGPKRRRKAQDTGSGVASVIVKGALSGALHAVPALVAERVARKALHRGPGSRSSGAGGVKIAEDASRGEAF